MLAVWSFYTANRVKLHTIETMRLYHRLPFLKIFLFKQIFSYNKIVYKNIKIDLLFIHFEISILIIQSTK